jgi:hypothetical protein
MWPSVFIPVALLVGLLSVLVNLQDSKDCRVKVEKDIKRRA